MPLLRMLSASSSRNDWSKTLRGFVLDSINSAIGTFMYSFDEFTTSVVLIVFLLFFGSSSISKFIELKNCCECSVGQVHACSRSADAQDSVGSLSSSLSFN